MVINQKNNIKIKSFILLCVLLTIFYSCNTEAGPVSGCYKIKDQEKYAVILDSTLYFMCGFDTAYIYDLKYRSSLPLNDSIQVRIYGILYSNALCRNGYDNLECPLRFEGNELAGSLPLVIFENNESFLLDSYHFIRQNNDAKMIFDKWADLVSNNTDDKILQSY